MIKIIPAILENNINDIKKRVNQIKDYTDRIHLDIMDGEFVPNTTFNDPAVLAKTPLNIKITLHLMINHPEFFFKKWADCAEVDTIIFHLEATHNVSEAIKFVRKSNKKVGIAINPRSSSYTVKDYINDIDEVLVMGVEPGYAAQAFNSDVLEKITYLKSLRSDLLISVDGGINHLTNKKIIKAGADVLCANSFIFKSKDIKAAIDTLVS